MKIGKAGVKSTKLYPGTITIETFIFGSL